MMSEDHNKESTAVHSRSSRRPSSEIDDVLLQPWFLPKRIADAIRGMVPGGFYKKMRYYFDDYGCMICGQESVHHSNGMCLHCHMKVLSRVKKSAKRHACRKPDKRLDLVIFRQQKLARNLLKGLARKKKVPAEKLTLQMFRPSNPVYEAFSAHHD